jgi:hypothetical protein
MADEDILQAIESSKKELRDKVEKKTFWDRVLPSLQAGVLLAGVIWAVATYYMDKHEKAKQPANISVLPTIVDLHTYNGVRIIKVDVTVENKGVRAFVINSPFSIRAVKLQQNTILGHLSSGPVWDGNYASEGDGRTLRSGETFGRGYWFEPGERDVRSYIVAVPEGIFDLITVHAEVRHAKVEDDAVHTRWELKPDHSLKAVTVVLFPDGRKEEYSRTSHADIWSRDAIAMNDASAQLPLWPSPSVAERSQGGGRSGVVKSSARSAG